MKFTGKTKNLGLIGYPVEHSLSPVMQNPALQAAALDYSYIAMPVKEAELETGIKGLRSLGFRGWNVTIPHKVAIMKYLDEADPAARIIGAVNTVKVEDGRLLGYNTDAVGFITALHKTGFMTKDSHVVVLGAGGAARAVLWGLIEAGAESICLGVRNPEKAQALADLFSSYKKIQVEEWQSDGCKKALLQADLLVNTTPLGMYPHMDAMPPIHWDSLNKQAMVYDIIYTPAKTKLLQEAENRGHRILNGEGMLVEQGAQAFRLWTGAEPDVSLMMDELKKALQEK